MGDPKSVYMQMLLKGDVVHVVSLTYEWWLVVVEQFVVDVFRRPKSPTENGDAPVESMGTLAVAPTIKEHRTFYLYGNDGISQHMITVESLNKTNRVPSLED